MMTMNKVLSEHIKNPNDLDGSKKRARDAAKALLPPKAKKKTGRKTEYRYFYGND